MISIKELEELKLISREVNSSLSKEEADEMAEKAKELFA